MTGSGNTHLFHDLLRLHSIILMIPAMVTIMSGVRYRVITHSNASGKIVSTSRVDRPSTRPVNSASGNRALLHMSSASHGSMLKYSLMVIV